MCFNKTYLIKQRFSFQKKTTGIQVSKIDEGNNFEFYCTAAPSQQMVLD